MLAKIALSNIKRSARDYSIYFVTLVLGVAVFYAFNSIAVQADFLEKSAAQNIRDLAGYISGLTVFIAFVMGFFMVYANNFLLRRRKRELGLYQVLGMRRSQVSFIITLETLLVALISFVVGIFAGMLLSQLLLFVTAALFNARVTHFHFFFSTSASLITLISFALIFVVMALLNLYSLRKRKLIELIGAQHKQRVLIKNVPLSIALFVLGCALVGTAYYRLLTHGFPVFSINTTIEQFIVTTVMVVVGTVLLFFGLGTVASALLRRSRVYWRGLNAFTLRQIDSQINSACMSMAMVSLVLFLAITSVTSGMSICSALNEMARHASPFSMSMRVRYAVDEDTGMALPADTSAPTNTHVLQPLDILQFASASDIDIASFAHASSITLRLTKGMVSDTTPVTLSAMSDSLGITMPSGFEDADVNELGMLAMSLSDFNATRVMLGMPKIQLADDEYAISSTLYGVDHFYREVLKKGYKITVAGRTLHASNVGLITDASAALANANIATNPGTLILPDDIAEATQPFVTFCNFIYTQPEKVAQPQADKLLDALVAQLGEQKALEPSHSDAESQSSSDAQAPISWTTHPRITQVLGFSAVEAERSGNTLSGLISYLAVYIGFVLIVSCATILAIQQLSAATDSASRYRTLAELGTPDYMLRRSLTTQISTSFVLPLIVGLAHSLCALKVTIELIESFGFVNLATSSLMVLGIFVVVYGGYLLVTYVCARSLMFAAITEGRQAL